MGASAGSRRGDQANAPLLFSRSWSHVRALFFAAHGWKQRSTLSRKSESSREYGFRATNQTSSLGETRLKLNCDRFMTLVNVSMESGNTP